MVVGDRRRGVPQSPKRGYIYLYERQPDGSWQLSHTEPPSTFVGLGDTVAIAGTTVVSGGLADDPDENQQGAVQFFRIESDGTLSKRGAYTSGVVTPPLLGAAVATDGDVCAAGAPGAGTLGGVLVIFEPDAAGTWLPSQVIDAPNSWDRGFGSSVALDGDHLVVGTDSSGIGNSTNGSLYAYTRMADGTWIFAGELNDPALSSVSLSQNVLEMQGDRLLVGVPNRRIGSPADNLFGGVLEWRRSLDAGWMLTATIEPDDPQENVYFGSALDLYGSSFATLSASRFNGTAYGDGVGAIHLYDLDATGEWRPQIRGVSDTDRYDVPLGRGGVVLGPEEFGTALASDGGDELLLWKRASLYQSGIEITATSGELHRFYLRAAESLAGGLFVVLGSATGTSPATPMGPFAVEVPLVVDDYTMFLVNNLGAGPFLPWIGVMNELGHMDTFLAVPPILDPSIVGTQLHHAFLLFDPVIGAPVAATNAVTLEFVQ